MASWHGRSGSLMGHDGTAGGRAVPVTILQPRPRSAATFAPSDFEVVSLGLLCQRSRRGLRNQT